ncbi:hypothetical protein DQ397_000758 [Pseudomonas sp. CK-NBRI-02]|uniref:hypothetical protein n=1 Tax=Pseudomonas sp. CK-NBRI-02 TaxID=2249759 RepID=UPI0005BD82D7|nr:hypothetical protein [Pseudomonas sp. CK-NBRI-02]TYO83674.1 hypothetical protein DQ397_000758 [Pseudomonas sp. CK-NBRI-02]
MFSEFAISAQLLWQAITTGLLSAVLVCGIFYLGRNYRYGSTWHYVAIPVVMVFLILIPHGWHTVFGTDPRDFASLLEARKMLPAASLLEADFWGVLAGAALGVVVSYFLPARTYW